MTTTSNSKIKENAYEPSLIVASERHEKKDFNMGEMGLLVEQEPTQVENILTGKFPLDTLSREVSKVDQQKILNYDSLNIPLVNQTNTPYNLRQSS